jgi:hypothetical protein
MTWCVSEPLYESVPAGVEMPLHLVVAEGDVVDRHLVDQPGEVLEAAPVASEVERRRAAGDRPVRDLAGPVDAALAQNLPVRLLACHVAGDKRMPLDQRSGPHLSGNNLQVRVLHHVVDEPRTLLEKLIRQGSGSVGMDVRPGFEWLVVSRALSKIGQSSGGFASGRSLKLRVGGAIRSQRTIRQQLWG